ncbi:MAG TPA: tyrosine-protein phosphatase [Streptosporangiaceae bacterium]|jgi:protein tyrosine/serine phosphatase
MTWIDLDGAVNVRDLGGLPADGHRIAGGRLLRGDNLQDLTPADVQKLVSGVGVTTVVDLRSPQEVKLEGPGPLTTVGSVRHAYHSMLPERGTNTDVVADAVALSRRAASLERYPDDARTGSYLGYLEDRPDQVVAALLAIAASPGAALVNCAAGKDRTGVIVAMALTVAGVDRDTVIADYAATGERTEAILARLRSSPTYAADLLGHVDEDHTPRPETMAAFLDSVQQRYGGVLAWLADHGFGESDADLLRARLLGS